MTEFIRGSHPEYHPERVSLVVATRGRPQQFLEMLAGACALSVRPEATDVWVFVDDDDTTAAEAIAAVKASPDATRVNWMIAPRQAALGKAQNLACAAALETSGLVLGYPDDYRLVTPGWDEILRQSYRSCPGRLALHYIPDTTALRDQITVMAASKEWIDTIGYFIPDHFPYWYGDSWLDEVSSLAGMKRRLDIEQIPKGGKGKTRRMWNLPFWAHFYRYCRLERLGDALRLTEAAGDAARSSAIRALIEEARATPLLADGNDLNDIFNELNLTAETGAPNRSYIEAEARACRRLAEWAAAAPVAFANLRVETFEVEAAFAASDTASGFPHTEQMAVCDQLLTGRAWGAIAAETGVGLGRLMEWRNAAALTLKLALS